MLSKKTLLSIAISFVFVFFVGYGIEVFHENPTYPDLYTIQNETACIAQEGEWIESPKIEGEESRGFCQTGEVFEQKRATHDKIVFIVATVVAILGIVTAVPLKTEVVSSGIVGGSVLTLLYGTIRYWQHAQNVLKFVLLGVALAVLLYLAYKKIK